MSKVEVSSHRVKIGMLSFQSTRLVSVTDDPLSSPNCHLQGNYGPGPGSWSCGSMLHSSILAFASDEPRSWLKSWRVSSKARALVSLCVCALSPLSPTYLDLKL